MAESKLTAKQQRFVEEYLIDLNATQAYARAGYKGTGNGAEVNACKLLRNTKVATAIEKAQKAREKRTHITQDRVLQELARLAFSDTRKLFKEDGTMKMPHEIDDDTAGAIAGIETSTFGTEDPETIKKVKLYDKNTALTNAMKHLGILTEKMDVNLKGLPASVDEFV